MGTFVRFDLMKELVDFFKQYGGGKKGGGTANSGGINAGGSVTVTVDTSTTINKIEIDIDITGENIQLAEITDKTELVAFDASVKKSFLVRVPCPCCSEPLTLWVYRFSSKGTDFIACGKYFTCMLGGKKLRFWIGVLLVGIQFSDIQLAGTELADIQLVDQKDNPGLYIWISNKEVQDYNRGKKAICGVKPDENGEFWIPVESGKIMDGIRDFLEDLKK